MRKFFSVKELLVRKLVLEREKQRTRVIVRKKKKKRERECKVIEDALPYSVETISFMQPFNDRIKSLDLLPGIKLMCTHPGLHRIS